MAFLAPTEQDAAHTGCQTHTDGAYRALDHAHGIIDYHTAGNHTTGTVDVKFDFGTGLIIIEQKQLRYHIFGALVVNNTPEMHATGFEEILFQLLAEHHQVRLWSFFLLLFFFVHSPAWVDIKFIE